ncbi:MAG: DUF6526 family protein, partial [Thermoanaerobaculia bacterium]
AAIGGSLYNVYRAWGRGSGRGEAVLILVLVIIAFIEGALLRIFALKAQDRAIRAEENLRHYALTGSLLNPKLDIRQIIGLRFAADEEFAELAERAAKEGLSETDIKKAVKNWRGDLYRV